MTAIIQATRLSLVLLLATAVPQMGDIIGTGIVFDRHIEDLRNVAVVGPEFMKPSRLIELANEFQSSSPTKPHVLIISAFASSDDASQTLAGKGTTEMTYGSAVERLRAARARGEFRMMRYIAIGNDAVVQTVNGTKASRSIVSGRDPTLISAGGITGEILYIYFTKLPRPIRGDGRNPVIVSIYLKTENLPTQAKAEMITESLQKTVRHESLRVSMRTDTWFLEEFSSSLWYPFSSDQQPPTYANSQGGGEVFCFVDEKGMHCRQTLAAKQ